MLHDFKRENDNNWLFKLAHLFTQEYSFLQYKEINLALCLQSHYFHFRKMIANFNNKQKKIERFRIYLQPLFFLIRYITLPRKENLYYPPNSKLPKVLFVGESSTISVRDTLMPIIRKNIEESIIFISSSDLITYWRNSASSVICINEIQHRIHSISNLLTYIINKIMRLKKSSILFHNTVFFRCWFMNNILITIINLDAIFNLFKMLNISLVVTSSDYLYWGRLITLVAKRLNIPSLTLQHGILSADFKEPYIVSTKIAVWGNNSKEWFIKRGVNHERVILTGPPRFDQHELVSLYTKEELCKKYNLDIRKLLVMLAISPHGNKKIEEMIRIVKIAAKDFEKKMQLILKLHPSVSRKFINSYFFEVDILVLKMEEPLYNLLNSIDTVIMYSSTIGLEALILGKNVIYLDIFDEECKIDLVKEKIAISVKNASQLRKTLEYLFEGKVIIENFKEKRLNYLQNNIYLRDGNATQRIVELINQMKKG